MHNSKPATEKDQTHFSLSWEHPAVSFKQQDAQVLSLNVQSRALSKGGLLDFKYNGDKPENNNNNKKQLAQENLKKKNEVLHS